jgi:hypothetical protein
MGFILQPLVVGKVTSIGHADKSMILLQKPTHGQTRIARSVHPFQIVNGLNHITDHGKDFLVITFVENLWVLPVVPCLFACHCFLSAVDALAQHGAGALVDIDF